MAPQPGLDLLLGGREIGVFERGIVGQLAIGRLNEAFPESFDGAFDLVEPALL